MTGKHVPITRTYPTDLQTHFVVSIVVQHQADHFILSFFEIWPPPILGETEEEKAQQLEAVSSIEAKCVARLVVTPDKMGEFLDVMNENYTNWQRKLTEAAENIGKES